MNSVVYRHRLVATPEILRRAKALSLVCDASAPKFTYLDCMCETHEVEKLIQLHELRATEPATSVDAFIHKYSAGNDAAAAPST